MDAEEYVIGICARLERCKGQDVFLRAAKRLTEAFPQAKLRFLVVGSGSEEGRLRSLAEHLGIARWVTFTGFLEDMAPVYRLLRINVNCSRGTETSCLALSEGMSAGVPMVVSDAGRVTEVKCFVPTKAYCSITDSLLLPVKVKVAISV